MSTAAQMAANIANAQSSTGPRTENGKAASSQNAVTHGLFARHDFIRPDDEPAYAQLDAEIQRELAPAGILEENLVDEIRRAIWRLTRCGDVEASLLVQLDNGKDHIPDPMQNEATAKIQNSVDRARAQAHRLLHRCTSELRRLQTGRQYRNEIFEAGTDLSEFGLADWRSITKSLAGRTQGDRQQMAAPPGIPTEMPFTKQTQSAAPEYTEIARNAPCRCNSGKKYKRCCGQNAPAVLHAA